MVMNNLTSPQPSSLPPHNITTAFPPTPILRAVRLLRNPRLTLKYFLQGVAECALRHIRWPSVLTRNVTGSIVVVLAGLWGLLHATCGGQFDSYFIVAQDNDQDMYLPSQYASWLVSATTEAFFGLAAESSQLPDSALVFR